MNDAHVHIVLVHLPIVAFPLLGAIFLTGILKGSKDLQAIALLLTVIVALFTIPAYLAGEGAEELVEHIAGVTHDNIEEHEEAALFAFISVLLTGALGLVGLALLRTRVTLPSLFARLLAALLVISSAMLAWTGKLGGNIRHSEIHARE